MKKFIMIFFRFIQSTLNLIESWGGIFFLGILFLSLFFQVVLRYLFNFPSPLLFEMAQYSFIWTIFLGAPYARKFDAHIKFDIVSLKFPRKVQLIIQILFDLFFSIILIVMLKPVFEDLMFYRIIRTQIMKIPWTYAFMCFPLFMILTLIHNVIWIVKNFIELFFGKTISKEVEPWA